MAEYYTNSSTLIPFEVTEEALEKLALEEWADTGHFDFRVQPDGILLTETVDWVFEPSEASGFVRHIIDTLGLRGAVIVTWANYCSEPQHGSANGACFAMQGPHTVWVHPWKMAAAKLTELVPDEEES